MDNKTKTRRIKTTAWAAFMLPFVAIGASLVAKSTKATLIVDECHHNHDYLCESPGDGVGYQDNGFFPALLPPDQRGWDLATLPHGLGNILPPNATPYTGNDDYRGYYEQPYFVKDYFVNLIDHLPTNNVGNCGYTALVMLLSYYDTYWYDKFILDDYNYPYPSWLDSYDDTSFSSPGVLDYFADLWTVEHPFMKKPWPGCGQEYLEVYYRNEREAYAGYLDKMLNYKDNNLISMLYDLALNSKIYDFDSDPKPGLGVTRAVSLINDCYFPFFGMGRKEAELIPVEFRDFSYLTPREDEQRQLLREAAIERLLNGQPLIFQGRLSDRGMSVDPNGKIVSDGGHMAIAYAYNKQTDEIIGHMGWKNVSKSECSNFDEAFETFDAFAYMDVKEDLEFSQSKCCFDVNGTPARAVDLESHVHKYKAYAYEDETYHALKCVCGHIEYEEHFFVPISCNRQKCTVCGKIIDVPFVH